ncbi:MAG: YigZ family protein [Acutalibacteraceae bacterium]|nr:YigZ family protein [Acutalibacteraceae bacterium]
MSYKTVKQFADVKFTEQKSKFIGYCRPVCDEKQAIDFINQIKQKHWDAKHNVYAYILKDGTARYSDDGEPQSTAGIPVLDIMKNENLCDTCIVVTRYFGGILLGTGGLVRAYSTAAKLAVNASKVITMVKAVECNLTCDYSMYSKINALLLENGCEITDSIFEEDVFLNFAVCEDSLQLIKDKITEITAGRCNISTGNIRYMEKRG